MIFSRLSIFFQLTSEQSTRTTCFFTKQNTTLGSRACHICAQAYNNWLSIQDARKFRVFRESCSPCCDIVQYIPHTFKHSQISQTVYLGQSTSSTNLLKIVSILQVMAVEVLRSGLYHFSRHTIEVQKLVIVRKQPRVKQTNMLSNNRNVRKSQRQCNLIRKKNRMILAIEFTVRED